MSCCSELINTFFLLARNYFDDRVVALLFIFVGSINFSPCGLDRASCLGLYWTANLWFTWKLVFRDLWLPKLGPHNLHLWASRILGPSRPWAESREQEGPGSVPACLCLGWALTPKPLLVTRPFTSLMTRNPLFPPACEFCPACPFQDSEDCLCLLWLVLPHLRALTCWPPTTTCPVSPSVQLGPSWRLS